MYPRGLGGGGKEEVFPRPISLILREARFDYSIVFVNLSFLSSFVSPCFVRFPSGYRMASILSFLPFSGKHERRQTRSIEVGLVRNPPRSKARQLFVSALQIVWHEFGGGGGGGGGYLRSSLLPLSCTRLLHRSTIVFQFIPFFSAQSSPTFRSFRFFPKRRRRRRPSRPYSFKGLNSVASDALSITTLPLFIYYIYIYMDRNEMRYRIICD